MKRLAAFGNAIDVAFPGSEWHHLQMIGIHPDHQGAGAGARLLRDGLGSADNHDEPVYLETAEADDVTLYEHFGFMVIDGSPAPFGPDLPTMWRMSRR